jgi:hypothetical protein
MKKIEKMAQIVGMRFDEAEKLFSMETLEAMQMVSVVGGGANNHCTFYGCNPANSGDNSYCVFYASTTSSSATASSSQAFCSC